MCVHESLCVCVCMFGRKREREQGSKQTFLCFFLALHLLKISKHFCALISMVLQLNAISPGNYIDKYLQIIFTKYVGVGARISTLKAG